ncbi:MAG: metallophosphoesterase [Armatimonadetes bacterium]|nr:metallophosphoesterase [Armatimonadota bacterium]
MTRRDLLGSGIVAGVGMALPSLSMAKTSSSPSTVRLDTDRFELIVPKRKVVRIMQVTDTHFGSPTIEEASTDEMTKALIRDLVEDYRPDLIFHTGDFINNDKVKPRFEAIEFMNELAVPWAFIFGNHDHPTGEAGQRSLDEYAKSLGDAVVGHHEQAGRREYCYRIDLRIEGSRPFASLIAFNTGSADGGMKVTPSQTEWFQNQLESDRSRGHATPILVMQHVPTVEYRDVFAQHHALGRQGEHVCFEQDQGEIFKAYAESGRVRAVFCGHDHVNDYIGELQGVKLVYGRCTGFSGYGDWQRGARLIDIDCETGRIRTRVVLDRLAYEKPEWSKTLAYSDLTQKSLG